MQTTKNLIMDSTCCRPAIMFCLLSLKCVVMRWDDILMDQRQQTTRYKILIMLLLHTAFSKIHL